MKVPQIRGQENRIARSYGQMRHTSEGLKKLIVEMYVGGMSQRDIEQGLESAVGHFLLSNARSVR